MPLDSNYRCDREFLKLLTRRAEVDLVGIALEIAREAHPSLDTQCVTQWIDERADEVRGAVARADSELEALVALGEVIHGQYGLTGSCAAFETADGSYLHRVIETRTGIPLSLSLLYIAVAKKVGLDLVGVAAPRHFLTRYESAAGPLFVDAYHGGRVLTHEECIRFLSGVTEMPAGWIDVALQAADARTIVIRMLNNLKATHMRREEWGRAWNVQHRLVSLQPAVYSERRDLGLIALRAGRPGCAIDLLRSCLVNAPQDEQSVLEAHLQEARALLCQMN